MTKILDIYRYLCSLAPIETQMDFDNSGFQLGRLGEEVKCVLLALDLTDAVLDEAIELNAKLIVTHHPLIFNRIKCLSEEEPEQARILKLAENRISVISMHTNLDIAEGGVNDALFEALGAKYFSALGKDSCGRIAVYEKPLSFVQFLHTCKHMLNVNALRYYSSGKSVQRIAVVGGAGADYLEDAYEADCDTLVTADIKYHQFLRASDLGMNLIDADHFCTENPVMHSLCKRLSQSFPDTCFSVSKKHSQIIQYYS